MKRLVVPVLALLAAGCASPGRIGRVWNVRDISPGYAIIVATFRYVPGESSYSRGQVAEDACYVAQRLSVIGYQAFVVDDSSDQMRVGVRASSWSLARALKNEIDRTGTIDLGEGTKIQVPQTEIVNIAELKYTVENQR